MRTEVSLEQIIDGWLLKYHGITVAQLIEKEPELIKTPDWYKKYAVTQSQHDEWVLWAKDFLRKSLKRPKWYIERGWWSVYLNAAPTIIKDET